MLLGLGSFGIKKVEAAVPQSPIPVFPLNDFTSCSLTPIVTFTWNPVGGAWNYTIQVSKVSDFGTIEYSLTTPSTNAAFYLYVGGQYFWRVLATNGDDNSLWSLTKTFNIYPQPPLIIGPLGQISSGNIVFNWKSCIYAPTEIQVSCFPDFSYLLFDTVFYPQGSNPFEYRFLYPYPVVSGHYWWRVKVFFGSTESTWAIGYFQVIYPPQFAPALISPVNEALIKNLNVNLNWTPVSGADKYEIVMDGSLSIVYTNSYNVSFSDNTNHQWRVRAGNPVGWGPWSEWRQFKILLPPQTPILISPQNSAVIQKTNSVVLTWSSIPTADSYLVQITDVSASFIQTFRVANPSLMFTGRWGDSYLWRVKAHNTSGESNWSYSSSFMIQENIPPRIEIDSYPQYTNQDSTIVSGKAYDLESGLNTLYLGNQLIVFNSNGSFKINLILSEGPNTFTLIAVDKAGNKTQEAIDVYKDTKAPEVDIIFPVSPIYPKTDVFTVISDIKITGTVRDVLPVTLLINNQNVSLDALGNFVFQTVLNYGPNKIYIKAVDAAGNVSEKTIQISKVSPVSKCEFQLNNPKMAIYIINGRGELDKQIKEIDPGRNTVPTIYKGRIFIPVRAFIENIGGTVTWNEVEKKITITLPYRNITLELWIGNSWSKFTDEYGKITWILIEKGDASVIPFIKNDRSYFPLRFIVERLGCTVQWDEITKKAVIEFPLAP